MKDTIKNLTANAMLAAAAISPVAGCGPKAAEPQLPNVVLTADSGDPIPETAAFDARKDALSTEASALINKDTKVASFKFEVADMPKAKKAQLDVLASQVYQFSTVCTPEAGKEPSKLRAFALPKGDGKTIVLIKPQAGQEVQLRVFAKAGDKEPLFVSGEGNIPNFKEGTPPNYLKPVFDKIAAMQKKGDILEGTRVGNTDMLKHYDFPVVQNYADAAKAGKVRGD
ncbi:MAG: hypothetical protein K2Q01_00395, partial [Rickettsiales bacterium]|nr:hypothetical protein [Rickettsiales bacterium]